ncbi:MAG TPA: ATP-binding protein [Allosphingosinicella sp.]|nr:ATP-binding protein [Allosphingosinicella sp.]
MAGRLHLVCGKIAAGKSTLCAGLAASPGTVTIAQDSWLKSLFGDELREVADYVRIAPKLNAAMGPHVTALLEAGLDVVLDFPANTRATRAFWRDAAEAAGARAVFHFIDLPDEVCRERLRRRNAEGGHEFAASDAQFDQITAYFQPPAKDEGLTIVHAEAAAQAGD